MKQNGGDAGSCLPKSTCAKARSADLRGNRTVNRAPAPSAVLVPENWGVSGAAFFSSEHEKSSRSDNEVEQNSSVRMGKTRIAHAAGAANPLRSLSVPRREIA